MGWKIFKHSLLMVFRNFWKALHIAGVPSLISAAVFLGYFFLAMLFGVFGEFDSQSPTLILLIVAGGILMFATIYFSIFWIVVAWHRFVLLEETPQGIFPPLRMDRMWAYFGRVLQIFAVFILPALLSLGVVNAFLQSNVAMAIAIGAVLFFTLSVFAYRLSLILPAAALGKRLTMSEAWEATKGQTGSIIALLLLMIGFQIGTMAVFTVLNFIPIVGAIVQIIGQMLLTILGASVLTTLYGVYVEKREL